MVGHILLVLLKVLNMSATSSDVVGDVIYMFMFLTTLYSLRKFFLLEESFFYF